MPIDTNMMANFSLMDSVDVLRLDLDGYQLLLLYLQHEVLMGVRACESEMDFVIRIKSWLYLRFFFADDGLAVRTFAHLKNRCAPFTKAVLIFVGPVD